jgi:hypothetical protein
MGLRTPGNLAAVRFVERVVFFASEALTDRCRVPTRFAIRLCTFVFVLRRILFDRLAAESD